MEAIIARRPASTKAPGSPKAISKQSHAAAVATPSEVEQLTRQVAGIIDVIVTHAAEYDESCGFPIIDDLCDVLSTFLHLHKPNKLTPQAGPPTGIVAQLRHIQNLLEGSLADIRASCDANIGMAVQSTMLLEHAQHLTQQLLDAYQTSDVERLRYLATFAGAKPHRDRPSPPPRRMPQPGTGSPASTLYPLALAWSEKINSVFGMLDAAKQALVAETFNSIAMPSLCLAMEQLRSCDEEGELLNALAALASHPPAAPVQTPQYTQAQLVAAHEKVAVVADTLSRTLMEAQQCTADEAELLTTLVDAAQLQARLIGGIADDASGGRTMGNFNHWVHGPHFAKKGSPA